MSNMDDELRDSLQRRADDVRPHREVPLELGRRAGRRVALNAVVGVAAASLVIVGAIVGVQALHGSGGAAPIGPPVPTPTTAPASTPATTAPSPTAAPTTTTAAAGSPCTSAQLRAEGSLTGAAGSREGVIDLSNLSDTTCTLQGRPTIDLSGSPAASSVVFIPSPAGWQADAQPAPQGWPVVTLHPGDAASVRIRWSNWCPQGSPGPLWYVEIPGGGAVPVTNGLEEPPPCNGPTMPSTIEVGPFEPQLPA